VSRHGRQGLVLGLALLATTAQAAPPYVPAHDGVVLETLSRPRLPGMASMAELRARWLAQPTHVPSALSYARSALEMSRRNEDPRYLGYAQAALAPWWVLPKAPPEVVLLRASLQLARMEFAHAEQDLQWLINSDMPEGHAARITRAGLRLAQGDPRAAKADCEAAAPHVGQLVATSCHAAIRGLQGDAAGALAALDTALQHSTTVAWPSELWARALAAELAQRVGQSARAQQHFDAGLRRMRAAESTDPALLAAYADFLLLQGDIGRVRALLTDDLRQDSLLLRLALAEHMAGLAGDSAAAAQSEQRTRQLALRFAEMRQRGDRSHLRDQALLELDLRDDPVAALKLMAESWQFQRDPVDARLYLRASLAAGRPDAGAPVAAWIADTGVRDLRLAPELARWHAQMQKR
jgi:hypothetical protein